MLEIKSNWSSIVCANGARKNIFSLILVSEGRNYVGHIEEDALSTNEKTIKALQALVGELAYASHYEFNGNEVENAII